MSIKVTSPLFQDNKERTDFFIALVVVAVFGLFIGYYNFIDDSTEETTLETVLGNSDDAPSTLMPIHDVDVTATSVIPESEETVIKSPDLSESIIITDQSSSTIESNNTFITNTDHPNHDIPGNVVDTDNQSDMHETDTADEITNPNQSDLMLSDSKSDVNTQEDSLTVEEANSASTVVNESATLADPSVLESAPELSKSVVKNIVKGKDCRIVVGGYRLKSSRDRMLMKLAETKYQVVTYKEKGLNIVAIHHSCDKEKLSATTKIIREKFAKGAFALKK